MNVVLTIVKCLKLSPVVLLLAALCSLVAKGQVDERSAILNKCANQFGEMIDAQENLFDINPLFVLRPRFDSHGALISLSVFPKYWLERTHTEWTEPGTMPVFSEVDYASLLARLDNVKPKGSLVENGAGSVITNSTEYFLDKYQYGYLNRGEYGPHHVRFLDIYPFHEVAGRVRAKRRDKLFTHDWYYQVLVGKINYFVRLADYQTLKPGRMRKFFAVGPVSGYCFDGRCNP